MEATQKQSTLENILRELENKEQMDSLYYLVQKLPDFTSRIQAMDDKLEFIESIIGDKQSLSTLSQEVEEKVEKLHINQEHFAALLEIVHLLPRLVSLMKKTEEISLFINDFLKDTTSVEYALKGINDIVPLDKAVGVIKETNEQFKEDKSSPNFSLYGMYRLLKDPTIQKGFRYLELLLGIINNKK
ncbi:hypothetical protein KHA94_08805 [Bacillus sp. FJAT-49705]|uniref:DUF1641 domain-containing protein n=1 Tax=Cytobacillus citreus TaxID=2833586 RepID=A0ABS5NR51_9BACI|nr:hypothetical protein [Cytobacillus citreus]MBS4190302.1 hypothetical protein [Cytobacillus citreus]